MGITVREALGVKDEIPTRAASGPVRYVIEILALAAMYAGVAKLSVVFAFVPDAACPVWPGTGIALVALLIWGYRMWPGIALGAYALAAITTPGPIAAIGITIGNTLEPVVALYLLRRAVGSQIDVGRVRDAVLLIVLAGIVATAISALLGVGSLYLTDKIPAGKKIQTALLVWWIGNISGCIVIAPFLLAFRETSAKKTSMSDVVECLLLILLVLAASELVFGFFTGGGGDQYQYPLTFLLFPPLVWASLRFGHRGASGTALAISLFAVIATVSDIGPFARPVGLGAESLAMLSAFMTTFAGTGLILSAAINERHRAAQARIEAEAKYHLLIEHASDGIFLTDKQGIYLEANKRGLDMLGYTIEELLSLKTSDLLVIDERDPRPARTDELQTGQHILSERRLRRKDGTHIPVEISAKKLPDGRFLGLVRDITDRKRAEEQRLLMIRELDHRVKNNLAVVLCIADQTARSVDSVSEFSSRFIGRIMALARVHGLLAQSHWTGTDLLTLVTRTLQPYMDTYAGRIRVKGDRCHIPARATGPLCMTLHELATNALKYGSLLSPTGAVSVEWSMKHSPDNSPLVVLTWTESGGSPVHEPAHRGFGTNLIQFGMAHEIRATVRLEFRPVGVWCEMEISLKDDPAIGGSA